MTTMPAFVALLGKQLQVSVLLDGGKNTRDVQRMYVTSRGCDHGRRDRLVLDGHRGRRQRRSTTSSSRQKHLMLHGWAFPPALTVGELPPNGERIRRIEEARGKFDHAPSSCMPLARAQVHLRLSAVS